jgi:anti-anti-sigma regulatory factor
MEGTQIITILLTILGFVGALGVKALMSIAKSVNEIKIEIRLIAVKHDALEKRVEHLEYDK